MRISDTKHRLKELMDAYDINQQDIADRTGIPKSSISMYVNGNRVPRQDKVSLIADAYHIEPAWIMGYDVPMEIRDNQTIATKDFEVLHKYLMLSKRDQGIINSIMDSMLKDSQ